MTRSQSRTVIVKPSPQGNWATELGKGIDDAVVLLSAEHDVISVTITPIFTEHYTTQAGYASAINPVSTSTTSVIVTVVWREEAGPQPREPESAATLPES